MHLADFESKEGFQGVEDEANYGTIDVKDLNRSQQQLMGNSYDKRSDAKSALHRDVTDILSL